MQNTVRDRAQRNMCFLAGPPLSGKTTVGRMLAGRLVIPFRDLDGYIEASVGMSVEEIFGSGGETAFRSMESRCLMETAAHPGPMIVALGGGTLLLPGNLETVVRRGVLVTLAPGVEELLSRAGACLNRPLARGREALQMLLESRRSHYESLPGRIDTAGMTPEEVAAKIADRFPFTLKTL